MSCRIAAAAHLKLGLWLAEMRRKIDVALGQQKWREDWPLMCLHRLVQGVLHPILGAIRDGFRPDSMRCMALRHNAAKSTNGN
jgi:hypothetical protein